ncbi:MAG: S41 family peptidase, partial [Planctomycetota bacterium]
CWLGGFGTARDGSTIVTFQASSGGDVYREPRPYGISMEGGDFTPLHGAFGRSPRVSPDGRRVLFSRGGSTWTRRHYRGPDARDVWMFDREDGTFHRLTTWPGNDGRARWAGNDAFVFLSDREDGCVNLYRKTLQDADRPARRLTHFTDRDVTHFDLSHDGGIAVFTAWDRVYRLDLLDPGAEARALALNASGDDTDRIRLQAVQRKVSRAALSPDGKVMATVAYGEVFVRNVGKDKPTRRVTRHPAREQDVTWSPDGTRLYFTSDRDGTESIYAAEVVLTRSEVKKAVGESDEDEKKASDGEEKEPTVEERAKRWHDALTFRIDPVVVAATNDRDPRPSPDGKSLAYRRGNGEIVVRDLEADEDRTLVKGWDGWIGFTWSPDGRWIAYAQNDLDFNRDIWMVRSDGSSPAVNVTRHPDNDWAPRFSADGKILAFLSQRKNDETDVWMVHLDRSMEALTKPERAARGRRQGR